ncbi:hypothetical protein LCGC14_2585180, partial [marine sediment metagenome]
MVTTLAMSSGVIARAGKNISGDISGGRLTDTDAVIIDGW